MTPDEIVILTIALREHLKVAIARGDASKAPLTAFIDDLQKRQKGFSPKYLTYGRTLRPYASSFGIKLPENEVDLHNWITSSLENLRKGSAPDLANLIIAHLYDARSDYLRDVIFGVSDEQFLLALPASLKSDIVNHKAATSGPQINLGRNQVGPENKFHNYLKEEFNLRDWEIGALRILQERKSRTGVLDLSKLRIDSLPDSVGDMTWLRDFSCGLTSITRLEGLHKLANLEALHCSYGKLRELPSLGGCEKLMLITCGVTPISSIEQLAACPSIERLYCGSTNVADLTPLRSCANLTVLHCEDTQVSELAGLEACNELRLLDCSDTSVTSLHPIERLPALETLLLNGCRIEEHSPALWQSPALKEVIFCRGSLKGIPANKLSRSFDENCLPRIREHLLRRSRSSSSVMI